VKASGVFAWAIAIVWLLGYEWWALATHHESLSRAVWTLTTAWPPLIFLIGLVVGGLVVHFWWRWDPRNSNKGA